MKLLFEDLSYCILPSADPRAEYVDLHNRVFNFWKDSLAAAFAETGNDPATLIDDFVRQDLITAILYKNEVVATLLLSFYTLEADAAREFRYLKDNYPETYIRKLKNHGVKTVMSMQYLTVRPDWRKKNKPVHLAPTIFALAQFIQRDFNIDAIVSVVRRDNKVNDLVYSLGGECIVADVENHHTPCDLIVMYKDKPQKYPSNHVKDLTRSLWSRRVDATQISGGIRKKAA